MMELRPEKGEFPIFFQNANPIVFVFLIYLFFDLLYHRMDQTEQFWTLYLESVGL